MLLGASHFCQQVSHKHIFSLRNYFGCRKAILLAMVVVQELMIMLIREGNTTRFKFKQTL
jgi:hypothetical protein